MKIKAILVKAAFFVLYYAGILLVSGISAFMLMELEYNHRSICEYIYEDIFGGYISYRGGGTAYLSFLVFLVLFAVYSTAAFLLLNKFRKKYSNMKMLVITFVFIIIYLGIVKLLEYRIELLPYLTLLLLPLVQFLSYKKKQL
ncbi:MAG: hypothetical protein FWG35_00770 [Spirochaetaceae bacterium]|nr:hypothetical protein [Spirochaetaceae bacterium]